METIKQKGDTAVWPYLFFDVGHRPMYLPFFAAVLRAGRKSGIGVLLSGSVAAAAATAASAGYGTAEPEEEIHPRKGKNDNDYGGLHDILL